VIGLLYLCSGTCSTLSGTVPPKFAGVAKLVDALGLGPSVERHMGSSPFTRIVRAGEYTLPTANSRIFINMTVLTT
jgi:hypothetical protein